MKRMIRTWLFAVCVGAVALLCGIPGGFAAAVPVDINTASVQILAAQLKGIGLKKARAIVEYRRSKGPFQRIEDLTKVKGIGPKFIQKNQAQLTVTRPKKK